MLWRNEGFYVLPVLSLAVASVLSFVVYVEDAWEEKYAALTGAVTNACLLVSTESASP